MAYDTPQLSEAVMEINPGGLLATRDIVGRDREIARYWKVLRRQGLILSAERRIGKTHIALKMRDECPDAYVVFYQDLESVHSIVELVRALYAAVSDALTGTSRLRAHLTKWSGLVPSRLAGVDLPDAAHNWKPILEQAVRDLAEIGGESKVLLIWDEFPLMLYNVRRREGESRAIELLDSLRQLRQLHAGSIRFLFTGSVGLHLVMRTLKNAGNANDPVNDMYVETVPPLGRADAEQLCSSLLATTYTSKATITEVSRRVVALVGGFPYYIHHVVDQLDQLGREIHESDVDSAVDALIHDARDPANLEYYETRISSYYDREEQTAALVILDTLAAAKDGLSIEDIVNGVNHVRHLSSEQIRSTLRLLVEDHYLETVRREGKLHYYFRWSLVKRWWRETRS